LEAKAKDLVARIATQGSQDGAGEFWWLSRQHQDEPWPKNKFVLPMGSWFYKIWFLCKSLKKMKKLQYTN